MSRYLTAKEAAEELGISLSTLYAYVSRGLIRSEETGDTKRTKRYRLEDVQRLQERKEGRKNPEKLVENTLHWGTPIMESALTLITEDGLFYRGHNVQDLVLNSTIEEVAALLWTGDFAEEILALFQKSVAKFEFPSGELSSVEAFQSILPYVAAQDLSAYDLSLQTVIQTGAKITKLMTCIAAGVKNSELRIAKTLQNNWLPENPESEKLLSAALILCADHELNISSFTARCVASAGATPYSVVQAGLSALQGVKHGGHTEKVEAFFRETKMGIRQAIASRLKRGESIPGFGHWVYPDGDPRSTILLKLMQEIYPDSEELAFAKDVQQAAYEIIDKQPTIDFALVTLSRVLKLPAGSPITIFALGRVIGWIGHALEQYQVDRMIRPRARYVGVSPQD